MNHSDDKNKCNEDYCCDMRGMLSFLILFLLSKKSMNGKEITDEIEKRREARPSPGTIYPALKSLKDAELIEEKKVGKNIIYNLTSSGKVVLKRAKNKFTRAFMDVF